MEDVISKTCVFDGCKRVTPCYNKPGSTNGLYCAIHKLDGMVDVKNKTCAFDECKKQPAYNKPGSTKGLFCAVHKELGMEDVISKTCVFDGCKRVTPCYNKPGSTNGLYCAIHKLDGMVDVKNKTCAFDDCTTRPNFGFPGHSVTRCKGHIESGMIVKPKSKCTHSKDCKEFAIYGICTPVRCETHKENFDLNLVEKECKSCNFLYILNKKGFCGICDPDEFNKTKLAKQNQVKNWLDIKGYKYTSCDKTVDNGECFKYRPDFLFDCGTHFVVLEVDENQHKNIAEECECVRMINIFNGLGLITKFLRYNPDKFKMDKSSKDPSFGNRMKVLEQHLLYAFEDEPVSPLSIKHLFYDNRETTLFMKVDI
jgi:hypothetical protein